MPVTVATLCAAITLTGCAGFTERNEQAKRVVGAPAVLGEQRTFSGRLTVTSRLVQGDGLGAAARKEVKQEERRVVSVQVDLERDLAAYVPSGTKLVHRVFSGLALYGRRPEARPDDARPWVRVVAASIKDPRPLDPSETSPVAGLDVLPPSILLDLVAGALAGSVRNHGEQVLPSGARAVRYTANVDVSKALRKPARRELDDELQRDIRAVLTTLGVQEETLHRGEFWIDAAGMLQRMRIVLREEPLKRVRFDVEFDLELRAIGSPVTIDRPGLEEEVVVPSVAQYLAAVAPPSVPSPSPSPSGKVG